MKIKFSVDGKINLKKTFGIEPDTIERLLKIELEKMMLREFPAATEGWDYTVSYDIKVKAK